MENQRPDHPSRCTWTINAKNSPHTTRLEFPDHKVFPDILHSIGQTPLVKLNNIPKAHGIKCEIYAKCEFFNPGGSVKDRIAYRMIQDAEDKGLLKPGYTIIEPTSGNTGIGLAMAAAVKGYKCIIVMPEKMSNEKVSTLHALGAEIVRTPTEANWDSPDSHMSVAFKLQKEIPNSIVLDQYTNPGNPLAHYDQTAFEIWNQCEGKIDYIVAGAGTGGTITGLGRKLKELSPDIKIIAVDPQGSILAHTHENDQDVEFYEVEGIGYDFIPTVLDRSIVDTWVKTHDNESLNAARMLIREEGLLCGGSSGAALTATLKIAKDIPEGKRVVVILPDGIRNYMTKFASDYWMQVRGFLELPCTNGENKWWWNKPVSDLPLSKGFVIKQNTVTCQDVIQLFEDKKTQQFVVSNDNVYIEGVVTLNTVMSSLISGKVKTSDFVEKTMIKHFVKVAHSTILGVLSSILEKESYAVVVDDKNDDALLGITNQSQLLSFITKNKNVTMVNNHVQE